MKMIILATSVATTVALASGAYAARVNLTSSEPFVKSASATPGARAEQAEREPSAEVERFALAATSGGLAVDRPAVVEGDVQDLENGGDGDVVGSALAEPGHGLGDGPGAQVASQPAEEAGIASTDPLAAAVRTLAQLDPAGGEVVEFGAPAVSMASVPLPSSRSAALDGARGSSHAVGPSVARAPRTATTSVRRPNAADHAQARRGSVGSSVRLADYETSDEQSFRGRVLRAFVLGSFR